MISNLLVTKDKGELLINSNQPLLFDSGNHFMVNHDVTVTKENFEVGEKEGIDLTSDTVKSYFHKQIEKSLSSLTKFSNNPYVFNNIAAAYFNSGKYEEALDYYKKVIDIDKKSYIALAGLGKLYVRTSKYDNAIETYNTMLSYYKNDINVMLNLSHVYLLKREIDASLNILQDVIKLDKYCAPAYNNIGVIYIIKSNSNDAIANIRKAININNRFANGYNNLGICFVMQNKFKNAIKQFLVAISINKNFEKAIKNLARAYQHSGEYDKSIEAIKSYISINEPDLESYDILAYSLFMLKKYDECLQYLYKCINHKTIQENNAEISRFASNIGTVLGQMGKHDEAEKHYIFSIQHNANDPDVYNNLIRSYLGRNALEKAKKTIELAKSMLGDNEKILMAEGYYLFLMQDYDESVRITKRVIENNPKVIDAYALLGSIYTDMYENYVEAVAITKQGLKYDAKNLALINNLAYALLMGNKINEARNVLNHINDTENIYINATRGLLLIKENNIKEGERLYNTAMRLARKSNELYIKIKKKKYIELARQYGCNGDIGKARNYVEKAKGIKTYEKNYDKDIEKVIQIIDKV